MTTMTKAENNQPGLAKTVGETSWLDNTADYLEKLIAPICNVMKYIAIAILAIMTVLIFVDVTIRNLFDKFIPGIMDLQAFSLVCMFYFAFAVLQLKKQHMEVDLVVKFFPVWIQNLIQSFVYLTSLVFFAVMFWQVVVQALNRMGILSSTLSIPISFFMFVTALGVFMLSAVLFIDSLRSISTIIKDGRGIWLIPVFACVALFMVSPFIVKSFFNLSGVSLGLLGLLVMLVLIIVIKMPIGFAMAMVGFFGLVIVRDNIQGPLSTLGYAPYSSLADFVLAVIPMFILMGALAYESGVGKGLLNAANAWFGRQPGGLGISAIVGCAGFSAVCSNSMACAVTMGKVALPEMRKHKYSDTLSTGCLAAGGTLGILIPPSMAIIFYGIVTEQSIGKLFMAGIIPGLLLTALFCLTVYIMAKIYPDVAPRGEKTTLKEKFQSLKGVRGMLFLIILIFGGIMGGFFSPTEAGAIGAVGAFIYALAIGKLTKKNFLESLDSSLLTTCNLLTILMGVGILGYFFAATQLPFKLAEVITGFSVNPYLILAGVILFYILLGCALNIIPMLLLTLPAIYPTITALGFDPIWFGIVLVVVMEMGQITPPVGINVFALKSIAPEVPIERIFIGTLPFVFTMLVCVIILVIFPNIVTFLPNLLF